MPGMPLPESTTTYIASVTGGEYSASDVSSAFPNNTDTQLRIMALCAAYIEAQEA